ncbi:MAG: sigma 54-interacting transcriptional regulator [Thaumarchaeota archaeon]|nr:sigma 54-interacting transcriptional regulator [Nitrososphaerota archaeon]
MPSEYEILVNRSYNSEPKYAEIMAGVPEDYAQIKTLRDLLEINYKIVGAKEQLRRNLIAKIRSKNIAYPGILGFDDDVVPALNRAILSYHDMILVGQIGQAKTKLAQIIATNLLSLMPVIKGSITNDCPMDLPAYNLVSLLEDKENRTSIPKFYVDGDSMEKIRNDRLDTRIEWVDGLHRFKYVLATPDISVKDLVGQIDAIRVTKKGTEMYEIESYFPGQLMQAKHGLFCIDELPVLDTRKQVSLLSVLQEGRFTTGAYPVIFEPKTVFFATANPIDYTHSGKIIEPLYDRLKSHIQTHYPRSLDEEMMIIIQEAKIPKAFIPIFLLKILARIVQTARSSNEINQDKGVSVRMGIHCLELLVGESERTRSIVNDISAVPRPCDIFSIDQSIKFGLTELDDTFENRSKIIRIFISDSIKHTSLEYLSTIDPTMLDSIKQEFLGKSFHVSQTILGSGDLSLSYDNQLKDFHSLRDIISKIFQKVVSDQEIFVTEIKKYGISSDPIEMSEKVNDEFRAGVIELILDGLCWVEPKILDRKDGMYFGNQ